MRLVLVILTAFAINSSIAQWTTLGNAYFENTSPKVLYPYGDSLLVGGPFSSLNGDTCIGIAIWNGVEYKKILEAPAVLSFAEFNDQLIVGGYQFWNIFDNYTGPGIWDFENWYQMDGGAEWPVGDIQDYAVYDTLLIAVGGFDEIGSIEDANTVAAWDGEHWIDIGGVYNGLGPGAKRVTVFQDDVYIGGGFGITDTEPPVIVSNIARWDGSLWNAVGNGIAGQVHDFVVDEENDLLYVGGSFAEEGSGAWHVASWDGENWEALTNFENSLNAEVYALCMYQGQLFAGGNFVETNDGTSLNRIARFDGFEWQPVGGGFGDDETGVFDLTVFQNQLHACGRMSIDGASPTRQVASYYLHPDSVTWGVPDNVQEVEIENSEFRIKVFSNPNNGQFRVELPAPYNLPLLITDLSGRQLHREELRGRKSLDIVLENAPSMVLVSLLDRGRIIGTTKVVVE